MKTKYFHLMILLALMVLLISACGGQSATATTQPQTLPQATEAPATEAVASSAPVAATMAATQPAVPTSSVPAEAATFKIGKDILLDPALGANNDSLVVSVYLDEGLLQVLNGKTYMALAKDFTRSEDGLDYVFNLRPGVKFHDGTPLNADAVIANFNRWFDPADPLHGTGTYKAWSLNFLGFKGEKTDQGVAKSTFDGIEKVNDLTVVIHLTKADPDFIVKLTDPAFSIISPAALKAPGFGTKSGVDGGAGRFRLAEWNDTGLVLQPFADYYESSYIPAAGLSIPFK